MISITDFLRWWRGELASILPDAAKIAFLGGSSARPATFEPDLAKVRAQRGRVEIPSDILRPDPPVIPRLKRPRRVDVTLPDHMVLKRRIEAPKKARTKLEALARLDLKRNTPIPDDAAVWTLGPERISGQSIIATQYVAKKADLAALRRKLAEIGVTVRRFRVADGEKVLLALQEAGSSGKRQGRGWRRVNAVLALSAIGVAGFFWLAPAFEARTQLAKLESELQVLRRETVDLRRTLDTLRAQRSEEDRLRAALQFRPRLVESLRNVTVSLTDDTWLTAMSFTPVAMTLSGETSGTASDLVLALSQNRQFGNPRLSGPTTRTSSGREKFEIATRPGGAE